MLLWQSTHWLYEFSTKMLSWITQLGNLEFHRVSFKKVYLSASTKSRFGSSTNLPFWISTKAHLWNIFLGKWQKTQSATFKGIFECIHKAVNLENHEIAFACVYKVLLKGYINVASHHIVESLHQMLIGHVLRCR